ncbi:MAG: hypothetical protein LC733_08695 [Actinobacteria bacterium]|nr:hypothetical protein [Actinomycetota bacterium]
MDLPVTEASQPQGGASGEAEDGPWLVDLASPLLSEPAVLALLEDPARPDRLAWNTFRTLALWDTDAWVPSLLEVACGDENPLSPVEWGGGSVVPWGASLGMGDICDVVLDGPEALVLVACTARPDPPEEQLRAAVVAALEASLRGGREAGVVLVAPPGSDHLLSRLEVAAGVQLHDGRLAGDLLAGALGWVSWPELGRIALDLAEESDPNPAGQVNQLVSELQLRFPGERL